VIDACAVCAPVFGLPPGSDLVPLGGIFDPLSLPLTTSLLLLLTPYSSYYYHNYSYYYYYDRYYHIIEGTVRGGWQLPGGSESGRWQWTVSGRGGQ